MPSGCVICRDLFDAAVGIVTTKCGHLFHNICIDRWLARSYTCPECRSNVSENSLTKLFFHDISGNNVERSLDTLKEQLRAKDLEIVKLDKAIAAFLTVCAETERGIEKLLEVETELQNDVSAIEREVQNISPMKAKHQMLLQLNNNLQSELEHMNNFKTIVEGYSNHAKKILTDMQVHASCEEGKVAIRRIATYCSIIKREIVHSKEEEAQLRNEITQLKHQIGIFHADRKEKIRRPEQHFNNFSMNSSSQSASSGSSPTLNISSNRSSQSSNLAGSTLAYCPSGENHVTPMTFDFPKKKGQKFDTCSAKSSAQVSEPHVSRQATSALHARRGSENEDAVSRIRYRLRDRARVVKRKLSM
ncbi:hypothetical protein AVEN_231112-1 [Araneus ventricosus]|uniref:RING-type domain-containing protein n=1 Tax=Araneus ventricosus TaxID=182803 RepID=A0A4Y2J7P8_ARAVE|nr:hypothetical protein AVEN_231112-1 [Araneus ventricosus]